MHPSPVLSFEAQGHYAALGYHELFQKTPTGKSAKRGCVTTFSRKSRKRLLELTARMDLKALVRRSPVIFITLTYADTFPDAETAKRHMRAFLERIRRIAPQASAIWRLEFQERGAPHFHFVFFNLPYIDYREVKIMWGEILEYKYWDHSQETPQQPFTRIEAIRNARQVMRYVSKYVAKPGVQGSGFNHVPYPHAGANGRVWGVFNRDLLPWGEVVKLAITGDRDSIHLIMWQFRRLMAKKWKFAAKSGRYKGAALFVDNSRAWYEAFKWTIANLDTWEQIKREK